ncbi:MULTISPECIES: hypothetical protein [unclassified Nocardiopsis]|uniref:hypothetical protein n=1 Tax=Nocardiopsis TaxID=2013 RepID=UPI00387B9CF2
MAHRNDRYDRQDEPERFEGAERPEAAPATGGLYIGGSFTGGAAATGRNATAEDASRNEGPAAPPPPVTARPVSAPPGQTVIGGHFTGGALAAGEGSRAANTSVRTDALTAKVLADLEAVRTALAARPPTIETEAVDDALGRARQTIEEGGEVTPTLLQRLLGLLRGGSTVLGEVARGTHAVQELHSTLCAIEERHGG